MKNRSLAMLVVIPLACTAITHVWNPTGFPDLFYDEGVYMYRAMHVLAGEGLQVNYFYDHPYFGQIFLASFLSIIGYPNSLNPSTNIHSIHDLYLIPRVLMGVLTIADTFLIYKISQKRYNGKVALLAATLFAVMPITWIFRRILLDSILSPFLLTSILFAMYSRDLDNKKWIMLSGIFLGISIFTKEVVFVFIPLVAFLIYKNNKNARWLAIWLVPVILIPLLWPLQAVETDQLNLWFRDIAYQSQRVNHNFMQIFLDFIEFDPVLFIIGFAGIVFSAIKRDWMILLWTIPFLILLSCLGYSQYFYWIPIIPALCIGAASMLSHFTDKLKKKTTGFIILTTGLGIFGLVMSMYLVSSDVSGQYDAIAYVAQNVHNHNLDKNNVTIISSPTYSWVLNYVFHIADVLPDYRTVLFHPIPTQKILVISDLHFLSNINDGPQLQDIYNRTHTIQKFNGGVLRYDLGQYPFNNMRVNYEGSTVDIRESR